MDLIMEIVFTITGLLFVCLNIYGTLTYSKKLFLSGLCYYCAIPLIDESLIYNTDKSPSHIVIVFIFIIQYILTIPISDASDFSNKSAMNLSIKIGIALVLINITGAIYYLYLNPVAFIQLGVFHIIFTLSITYSLYKRAQGLLLK